MNSLSWGDNYHRFGPFLFARDRSYKRLEMLLNSGKGGGNRLRLAFYGVTFIIALPRLIKPYVGWVDLSGRDWATPGPDGRKGYEEVDERSYGITVFEGHMSVKLGRQTMDSSTTQSWGCFLPWANWRYIRKSWYGLDGEHLRTDRESKDRDERFAAFEAQREFEAAMPKAVFAFKDFDGEDLTATTHIVESEWRFGTGYFKWLSLFRPRRIRRYLEIQFSGETGERKGSWKGGTVGHAIEIRHGELHETAFRRYCAEHKMIFLGVA